MNPQTPYQNSIASTSSMDGHEDRDHDVDDVHLGQQDPDLDHSENKCNEQQHIINTEPSYPDLDFDQGHDNQENILNNKVGPLYCTDNNPPESYAICQAKIISLPLRKPTGKKTASE
ncbi:hypothetical protein Tco_0218845 [Tanacetum coccineum]